MFGFFIGIAAGYFICYKFGAEIKKFYEKMIS